MGMFDEVSIEAATPDPEAQGLRFQTKDFDCTMAQYTITADGRLVHHTTRYESVPEHEQPYYGTPEWERGGLVRLFGMLRSVPTGDVEIPHHGDINLYASIGDWNKPDCKWFDYRARFTNGRLESITRVGEDE